MSKPPKHEGEYLGEEAEMVAAAMDIFFFLLEVMQRPMMADELGREMSRVLASYVIELAGWAGGLRVAHYEPERMMKGATAAAAYVVKESKRLQ